MIVIKLIRIKTYYFFTNNKALIIILNQVKKMKVTPIKYNLKLVPHKKKCHWKLKQVTENTNKYFKNIISIIIITGIFCHSIRHLIIYLLKVTPIKYKIETSSTLKTNSVIQNRNRWQKTPINILKMYNIYNNYRYFCHSIGYQILYLLKVTPIKYKIETSPT